MWFLVRNKRRLLICILFLLTAGCSNNSEPKELLQGFKSYTLSGDILSDEKSDVVWKITEHSQSDDKRPKYDLLVAETNSYFNQSWEGKTVITFYLDQLMEVRFYPVDVDGYSSAMKEAGMAKEKQGVRCWSASNFKDDLFFACEEMALSKEYNQWLKKYS